MGKFNTTGAGNTVALMSAAYIGASPLFVANVIPILVGAVADRFHADPTRLGLVNSCYMSTTLLTCASAPFWIGRVSWPWMSSVAALGIMLDFLFAWSAPNFESICAIFLVAGLFSGLLGAPSNASLGFSSAPARWYGVSMLWQNVAAGGFALIVPSVLQPHFGPLIALTAMAVMYLPCVLGGWLIRQPIHSADSRPGVAPLVGSVDGGRRWVPLCAAFAGTVSISAGGVAYWLFVEQMGHAAKISASFIGLSIAISCLAAIIGATLVATAARLLSLLFTVGLLAGIASYLLMHVPHPPFFMASVCLFNFAWSLSLPTFQAIIRCADFTNRLFVANTATIFFAGVAIGPIAGHVAERWGYSAVLYVCAAFWIVALSLGLFANASNRSTQVCVAAAL